MRINEIETQFNTAIKDQIEEILVDIEQLRVIIPEEMRTCVNDDATR